ncbi:sulfotransferase domain-containing protein [Legionella oakridgensis]|uniref:Sulfotransferase domain protein n=2 Tax=Legionella oakridgensis TaxID=29423 RepID=W0BCI0_9GAMM|nr:sulfotransferase domain-containing protein [Legionella oakridgensis]AHE67570.1 sulfotransferase domain protein [Legionella oakridgensis ATCC 33761 = DSM 21215]ETO92815.1 sulfotransferase domain protein [Legionella oakridgensis RV-2-2007]KTD37079.1 Sulfotransferase domain protein [Legionella oakridgensis]STY20612.1 Sulfotransferase domain [Legionella longbeachae]
MTFDKGIVWLASYPKSGNTWFRIVLTNLLYATGDNLDLNRQTILGTGAGDRFMINRALGFDSNLLNEDEIERLKPLIYRWFGEQHDGIQYFKIHDAYYKINNCIPLVPSEVSVGIIYFIRNPLDVAISFAHHMNCSIDSAIGMMNTPSLTLRGFASRPSLQVRQICSSWSSHVESWVSVRDIRLLILRYEDMNFAPLPTFSKAFDFLGIKMSDHVILTALEKSRFEKLKQYEETFGFRESSPVSRAFFRKGIVGDWENTLNEEQIKRIVSKHGAVMRRFGYLNESGEPIRCHVKQTKMGN